MNPPVAVTYSLYGGFDRERLKLALKSAKQQTYSPLEIIVAEQNQEPSFADEARRTGVRYTSIDAVDFNTGRIRNRALALVTADIVYTNDADIIFPNREYLRLLVERLLLNKDLVLHKPPMRRLPLLFFEDFKETERKCGLDMAVTTLFIDDGCIAKTRPQPIKFSIVERNGKEFTILEDDINLYLSSNAFKGDEPLFFFPSTHAGATIARMEHIEQVGGYAEVYMHYGWEDADLQWKLGERFALQKIPKEESLMVMHLDHKKPYHNKVAFQQNKATFERRVREGISNAIFTDQKRFKQQ